MSKPLSQPAVSRLANPLQEAAERDYEAGKTLLELERRQDDVLSQLDDLDQKLTSILRGLGVTMTADEPSDTAGIRLAVLGDDDEDGTSDAHFTADPDDDDAAVSHGDRTAFESAAARRRAA